MSIQVSNTMAGTAGTDLSSLPGQSGGPWFKSNGATGAAIVTAANRLRGNGAAQYSATTTCPARNTDVTVTLYVASLANAGGIIVGGSGSATDTNYLIFWSSTGGFNIYTLVGGSNPTTLAGAYSWQAGQTYQILIQWRVGVLYVSVNGVLQLTFADANITTQNHVGVYFAVADTDTTGFQISNFVASTPATTAITSANVFLSPYNWKSNGSVPMLPTNVLTGSTAALTNDPLAYIKLAATAVANGYVALILNTASLNGITAANCPALSIEVDGGVQTVQLPAYSSNPVLVTISGLAAGAHTIKIRFKCVDLTSSTSMGDRWNVPDSCVTVTGIETDGTGTVLTVPITYARNLFIAGESATEGADTVGTSLVESANDSSCTWVEALANALQAEYGGAAYSAIGWAGVDSGGSAYGNVPEFYNIATPSLSVFSNYYAGASRLFSGKLTPTPTAMVVYLGSNDSNLSDATVTATVTAAIGAMRSASGSTVPIVCSTTAGGQKASAIYAGVIASEDSYTGYVNQYLIFGPGGYTGSYGTPAYYSSDGIHLSTLGHALAASAIMNALTILLLSEPAPSSSEYILTIPWIANGLASSFQTTVLYQSANTLVPLVSQPTIPVTETPAGSSTYAFALPASIVGNGYFLYVWDGSSPQSAHGVTNAIDPNVGIVTTKSNTGFGANVVTIIVNDGTNPIQNANVGLTQGASTYSGLTDSDGQASFSLSAATYTVAIVASGYSFTPVSLVVSGSQDATYSMIPVTITPAIDPDQTAAYCYTRYPDGTIQGGRIVKFTLLSPPTNYDYFACGPIYATSDAITGLLTVDLIQGAQYSADGVTFTTPTAATYRLPAMIGV